MKQHIKDMRVFASSGNIKRYEDLLEKSFWEIYFAVPGGYADEGGSPNDLIRELASRVEKAGKDKKSFTIIKKKFNIKSRD